jgi:DNA-binding transcriptional LysR family regulator
MDVAAGAPGTPARFRVGFVAGATPDKWARAWAERMPRRPLDLVPLGDRDGVRMLHAGELAMCLVRLPVDREGLHLIPLYDEQPVVVVSVEHPVAAYDVVDVAELADEHLLQDPDDVPAWRDVATEVADGSRYPVPDLDLRAAVESVAADAGILVLPQSVARMHHRRDVVAVQVTGVPTTTVGLAWRTDLDDDRVETFVGVVRGRTANSSRAGGSGDPAPTVPRGSSGRATGRRRRR